MTKQRRRYSQYSESRWGEGTHLYDDVARQLNADNRCCSACGASTSLRLLRKGVCPDCDGRAAEIMGDAYVSPFIGAAALQAGLELNALIAEKWMGWTRRVAGPRQIVRDDACLNLAHTHCEYCGQREGNRHIVDCEWLDRLWQWDMGEGDYEDEETPKCAWSQDWAPSTNPAHAGEARRKAGASSAVHGLSLDNVPCCEVRILVRGCWYIGSAEYSETNGDKGKAEALATCRAIVATLQAAMPAGGK